MRVTLTIIRYPRRFTYFGLVAMGWHRVLLSRNKEIGFFKLLGSGKNGTFDVHPDWQQWGILAVNESAGNTTGIEADDLLSSLYGERISAWIRRFRCESWTVFLQPLSGHGSWDGRQPFQGIGKNEAIVGTVATLTRASIRFSRLRAFWKNVAPPADQVKTAPGFIMSLGIGELPLIKQATFSVWESAESMKSYAYGANPHAEVIRKTRGENWYSEEMFVRFKPLATAGTIRGVDPLAGKL